MKDQATWKRSLNSIDLSIYKFAVQVRGFWAQLEAATNERQQAMFRVLNVHLKHLAQRVEAAVGEILEVTHTPVLAAATNVNYHGSVYVAVAICVPQTRHSVRRAYHMCSRNTKSCSHVPMVLVVECCGYSGALVPSCKSGAVIAST